MFPATEPLARRMLARDLDELLANVDFVVLGSSLNASPQAVLSGPRIEAMRPGSFLVNMALGGLVDEQALVAALRSGRLAKAALDVTAEEPLDPETSSGRRRI